jgi:hypothetical protein
MADAAAPANLMGYLFAKDVVLQSIRLGLAGAWDYRHPELIEALHLVRKRCPRLMNSFLPDSEHDVAGDSDSDIDVANEAVSGTALKTDPTHVRVRVTVEGFTMGDDARNFLQIGGSDNLDRLSPICRKTEDSL